MKHNIWVIPTNAMTKDEIRQAVAMLVMCGYTVRKHKFADGKYKGMQYIEYWRDEDGAFSEVE